MAYIAVDPLKVRPLPGSIVSPHKITAAGFIGRLVYALDDSTVALTDAATPSKVSGQIGQIVGGGAQLLSPTGAVAANEMCDILWFGRVTWGVDLDPTKNYFVGNSDSGALGKVSDTAGDDSRRIGKPEDSDVFFFNPESVAFTST